MRFPIRPDGSLGDKEIVGPESLGRTALPDGLSFDPFGNIWVTIISENALYVIDKSGCAHTVYRDANEPALEILAAGLERHCGTVDHLAACAEVDGPLRLPTSIGFSEDGSTAYVGTLGLTHLATFRLPDRLD